MHSWWGRRCQSAVGWLGAGEGHDRRMNSSSGAVVRLRGEHSVRKGRTSCSGGEELLTWSAVLALGRRVVAVLLWRWGLWNTSTVSYGRR